jgi:hypothetical protein
MSTMLEKQKQTYIDESDRPVVDVSPDTPVSELRVRDLVAVLRPRQGKTVHPKFEGQSPLKEFFDKPFPEVVGVFGLEPAAGAQAGPTPDPWSAIVAQATGLQETVRRLEDQVTRLAGRIGG